MRDLQPRPTALQDQNPASSARTDLLGAELHRRVTLGSLAENLGCAIPTSAAVHTALRKGAAGAVSLEFGLACIGGRDYAAD